VITEGDITNGCQVSSDMAKFHISKEVSLTSTTLSFERCLTKAQDPYLLPLQGYTDSPDPRYTYLRLSLGNHWPDSFGSCSARLYHNRRTGYLDCSPGLFDCTTKATNAIYAAGTAFSASLGAELRLALPYDSVQ
jgi:hypothetical protein